MTKTQQDFFNEYCANKYATNYFYRKYGKENVDEWHKQDWFINAIIEHQSKLAHENELATEQMNNLKSAAYDIVARGLKGEVVTDHQVNLAKWILSGERSYIEARAKMLGEKAADGGSERRAPIIELIRKKTD